MPWEAEEGSEGVMTMEEFLELEKAAEAAEAKEKRRNRKCCVCGQRLGIPGGMANTGMCGPCCTGEADSIEEIGETW